MTKEQIEIAKQKMKEYRDIFGNELCRKDLIEDAKSIFDLEDILNYQSSYIEDMASDSQSDLSKFRKELGVF